MSELREVWAVAAFNFYRWKKNMRIVMTFVLAFVMCLLLTQKAVAFAEQYHTTMQIMEAFIWAFGDGNAIMLSSLLLVLLFADMPFLNSATPYFLVRTSRRVWVCGQMLYIVFATTLYVLFILIVTAVVCMPVSFTGNMWSETGAMLGYSGMGSAVALPASVKVMEFSLPYQCAAQVFLLLLFYSLFISSLMLTINLWFGQFWGVACVFAVNLYGLFLNPQVVAAVFRIRDAVFYKANVGVGWLSPLNHATYYMHNFGLDYLPRVWMSYLVFAGLIALLFALGLRGIKRYHFMFTQNGR